MKRLAYILLLFLATWGLGFCNDSKEYEDVFRNGSWYVYEIGYDYQFRAPFATIELEALVKSLLDDDKLLFYPGDELVFHKKSITVKYPGDPTFSYDFYYWGDYIRVGSFDTYFYNLLPEGDNKYLDLVFDWYSLRGLIEDICEENPRYEFLFKDLDNLRDSFYIVYRLQRTRPEASESAPESKRPAPRLTLPETGVTPPSTAIPLSSIRRGR